MPVPIPVPSQCRPEHHRQFGVVDQHLLLPYYFSQVAVDLPSIMSWEEAVKWVREKMDSSVPSVGDLTKWAQNLPPGWILRASSVRIPVYGEMDKDKVGGTQLDVDLKVFGQCVGRPAEWGLSDADAAAAKAAHEAGEGEGEGGEGEGGDEQKKEDGGEGEGEQGGEPPSTALRAAEEEQQGAAKKEKAEGEGKGESMSHTFSRPKDNYAQTYLHASSIHVSEEKIYLTYYLRSAVSHVSHCVM